MNTVSELTIPTDDAVLLSLTHFDVSYTRGLSLNYQTWSVQHSQRVTFLPQQSAADRRVIVQRAYELVRQFVVSNIIASMPELEAMAGNDPKLEALKASLGVQS